MSLYTNYCSLADGNFSSFGTDLNMFMEPWGEPTIIVWHCMGWRQTTSSFRRYRLRGFGFKNHPFLSKILENYHQN